MSIQSMRRRGLSALTAAALVTGLSGILATAAQAAPVEDTGPTADAGYSESIQLSWDGSSYAAVRTEDFFGLPVDVPGETATRTLLVRNDGPSDATLRATIVNVNLRSPGAVDIHHNPNHHAPDNSGNYAGAGEQGSFYDDLTLRWEDGGATFTELDANGTTQLLQIPLAQGEAVPITLTYDFPAGAASGNKANVDPRRASFGVLLELGGDLPPQPAAQDPAPPADDPAPPAAGAFLPDTGADLLWPALGAGILLGMGALLLGAARRRAGLRGHR